MPVGSITSGSESSLREAAPNDNHGFGDSRIAPEERKYRDLIACSSNILAPLPSASESCTTASIGVGLILDQGPMRRLSFSYPTPPADGRLGSYGLPPKPSIGGVRFQPKRAIDQGLGTGDT
jgi:hypothetical protein